MTEIWGKSSFSTSYREVRVSEANSSYRQLTLCSSVYKNYFLFLKSILRINLEDGQELSFGGLKECLKCAQYIKTLKIANKKETKQTYCSPSKINKNIFCTLLNLYYFLTCFASLKEIFTATSNEVTIWRKLS